MSASRSPGGVVVYRRHNHSMDAIDEYSRRLVGALVDSGHPVTYVPDGLSAVRRTVARPPWILLQYMPFSYGHWGIAPDLISDAIALKRATGATFAVMIHEAWIPMEDWRTCLIGAYQRLQLRALLLVADAVIVPTESLVGVFDGRPVHIPVASNITPNATTRRAARSELGIGDELVVTMFGTGQPHRALEHAEEALATLVAERGAGNLRVLNLGAGARPLQLPSELRVDTPGALPAADVSLRLRASDLLLMTFTDGVSTRRTTLMAGLAHGLPVVGLRGVSTDGVLLSHPEALVLTPVGDRTAFAHAVLDITSNSERLEAAGRAARALYVNSFDWPVAATRVMMALDRAHRGASLRS